MRAAVLRTAAIATLLVVSACAAGAPQGAAPATSLQPGGASPTTAAPNSSPTPARSSASPSPSVDVGLLPQTDAKPSAADPLLTAHMHDLWRAIVTGNPADGMPAFFPLTAYLQTKALSYARADWHDRLVALYDLDIAAYHRLLGPLPGAATLVGYAVPESSATWIVPGVEYNKGPYWRVYNTRLDYRIDGAVHSVGVFSMISWRGEWYLVHLGYYPRGGFFGVVDQPR
jgi:hypothetical protein